MMYNIKISYNGKNTQIDTNAEMTLATSFKEDEMEVINLRRKPTCLRVE